MKNEILDEPIRDSFSDYLEKGETILWKGEPDIKRKNYGISIEGIVFYFLYSIVSSLIQSILHIGKNKKTDYAISTKRILFRLAHWNKNKIHDIPFPKSKTYLSYEMK